MGGDVERFAQQLREEKQREFFDAQAEVQRLAEHLEQVEETVARLAASQGSARALSRPPLVAATNRPEGDETARQAAKEEAALLKSQLEEAVQEMKRLQV